MSPKPKTPNADIPDMKKKQDSSIRARKIPSKIQLEVGLLALSSAKENMSPIDEGVFTPVAESKLEDQLNSDNSRLNSGT